MIVVDASVWVAIVLKADVFNDGSERWLSATLGRGEALLAPAIVLPEVAGSLRRRTGDVTTADHGRRVVEQLLGQTLIEVDRHLADLAARLAADHGLRGADAVYAETAARHGCPLVTWDDEMIRKTQGVDEAREPAT